jgi:FkbM family methyltransferase
VNNEIKLKKNLDFEYQFHSIAIDSSNGVSNFFVNTNFPASGSSIQQIVANDTVWRKSRAFMMGRKDKDFEKIRVTTQTLDSFCNEKSIKAIDVLKIDVEGNELRVLRGATDTLKACSIVLVEVLDHKTKFTKKMNNVETLMADNGFLPMTVKNIPSVSFFSSIKAVDVVYVQSKLLTKYNSERKAGKRQE